MTELMPCPCGQTPTELHVTSHDFDHPKWAMASGNCCNDWNVEFRNEWARIGSTKCAENAARAWNAAPRAKQEAGG